MIDFRLCLVTDRTQCQPTPPDGPDGVDTFARLRSDIDAACRAGVRVVQIREKDLDTRDLLALADDLRHVAERYGCRLLVNDRVDIALTLGLDGVHCPERGFPPQTARELLGAEVLIGVSCHGLASARGAEESGADFVFFGPVYATPAKTAFGSPVGLDVLHEVCSRTTVPVFAIGGITAVRSIECMEAGASGVAVISAIFAGGAGVASSVREFKKALGRL